ncbi:Hypothetical protein Minf_1663 [Methylacidiphilum infernorum V4]|uniref:Uncharacterized protein n=1 Tax=Methylacidiphilum infernorum (isolate V4) TaxID=481448 RepID=B3DWQ4_METI4|nr:Hypothetical protein Minf_1663 [Methylacidiphilum infernorum V4]
MNKRKGFFFELIVKGGGRGLTLDGHGKFALA